MRFANRASRRLARTIFHAMLRFGPELEKRQALLGRIVDIGADLFIMTSACARAMKLAGEEPGNRTPFELADTACKLARRRIGAGFRSVFRNDDTDIYKVARGAMDDRYAWLEAGIADDPETDAPAAHAHRPKPETEPARVTEPVPD